VTGRPRHVVVIGAGAFGGWTALELVRRGLRVTLVDAWGPGHARASSGGETRIIRATYGSRAIYTTMATRALALWREHDAKFNTSFFRKTGAIWLYGRDDAFVRASVAALHDAKHPLEEWSPAVARRRLPQINWKGLAGVVYEPEAGYLLSRRACEHVADRVVAEGGTYVQSAVKAPVRLRSSRLSAVTMLDGTELEADAFVFACGPWLGQIFPDVIGRRVKPTRQDVFYFGPPAGDTDFEESRLPVWVEIGKRAMYGIPGNANRGFKICDDSAGAPIDPTSVERTVTPASLRIARRFMAQRFPALARAPLIGTEVCQYEATPDSDYILDRHPRASNVWIAGGGSGHGFKMGPVIGEMMTALVLGADATDVRFSIGRFGKSARRLAVKWA